MLQVGILLGHAAEQFAQLALGLGVVGVVCGTAHGAGSTLLELFAQLHNVLRLAQGVGGGYARESLFGHLYLHLHAGGGSLLLCQLGLFAALGGCLFRDAGIPIADVLPQHGGTLERGKAAAVVGRCLLQFGRVVPLVGLAVNEQFALQGIKACLLVVLLLLCLFALCAQLGLALAQLGLLVVALYIAACFIAECGELVHDKVELVEHLAVCLERLLVQLVALDGVGHLGLLLLLGLQGGLALAISLGGSHKLLV